MCWFRGFNELLPSDKVKWLLEGNGVDYKTEQNMELAAEIIEKEIAKYEVIQEKFRKDKCSMHNEDDKQQQQRETKSSMLLMAMYNLEDKMKKKDE